MSLWRVVVVEEAVTFQGECGGLGMQLHEELMTSCRVLHGCPDVDTASHTPQRSRQWDTLRGDGAWQVPSVTAVQTFIC